METNVSAGPSLSSDTRQGRSEKRAFPRKRVSVRAPGRRGQGQHEAPTPTEAPLTPGRSSTRPPARISWFSLGSLISFPILRVRPVFCVFLSELRPALVSLFLVPGRNQSQSLHL